LEKSDLKTIKSVLDAVWEPDELAVTCGDCGKGNLGQVRYEREWLFFTKKTLIMSDANTLKDGSELFIAQVLFHEMTHYFAGTADDGYVKSSAGPTPTYQLPRADGTWYDVNLDYKMLQNNADTYDGWFAELD
jgi:hypothetical protein